jgi:chromosome segregation ATPase
MDPITPAPTGGAQTSPTQTAPPIQASAAAPVDTQKAGTATLEEEVARELGTSAPVPQIDKLEDKARKLNDAEKALEAKIATLEEDVKAKLISLKSLKSAIEEEIVKIKELKDTGNKISLELEKIKELEKRRAEIETEIQTIEQTTQGL